MNTAILKNKSVLKIDKIDFLNISNQFLMHKRGTQWNSLNRKFSVSLVWSYGPIRGEKYHPFVIVREKKGDHSRVDKPSLKLSTLIQ